MAGMAITTAAINANSKLSSMLARQKVMSKVRAADLVNRALISFPPFGAQDYRPSGQKASPFGIVGICPFLELL